MDLWVYEFELKALNSLHFASFSGPSFRGGFGSVLRQLTCVTRLPDCQDCPVRLDCPFTYLFKSAPPAGDTHFVNEAQVPRPFILETPDVTDVSHGKSVRFRVTLAGKANEYLPYIALAYRQLGMVGIGQGRGKYKLVSVSSIDPTGARLPIQILDGIEGRLYLSKAQPISFDKVQKTWEQQSVSKLKVSFVSPTHLVAKGRSLDKPPEFEQLLRAVLRRYSDLAALYGEGRPQWDYRTILETAKEIRLAYSRISLFRRRGFSSRKGQETPTEGLTGDLIYEGGVSAFMPYLIFGQWLHVGKQATFGMGRYKVELVA